MKIIDYVFYRVYTFYRKFRDSTPIAMGCLLISVAVFFTVLDTIAIINKRMLPPKIFFLILTATVAIVLGKRYTKKEIMATLETRYGNEPRSRKRLWGILIVAYLILVLAIPTVGNYYYLKLVKHQF